MKYVTYKVKYHFYRIGKGLLTGRDQWLSSEHIASHKSRFGTMCNITG